MRRITLEAKGSVGQGKSTILQLITKMFSNTCFTCSYIDDHTLEIIWTDSCYPPKRRTEEKDAS